MNHTTRRLRLAGFLTALLLPALALADGLADILARKTVRIGVCEFAPWTFTNRAGLLEGFAKRHGVTPHLATLYSGLCADFSVGEFSWIAR
jgi:ABC-type amino acid transport substrate-binding protein